MEFAIITLFPQVLQSYFNSSIIGRAAKTGLIKIKLVNLRDFGKNQRKTVDSKPFGGGVGMILRPDVAVAAIEKTKKQLAKPTQTILLTPAGIPLTQKMAKKITNFASLVVFCGRYEGIDERLTNFIDLQISIGDFILTGGELGAAVIVDVVTRLIPGVLPKIEDQKESFADNLLAAPVYTKPVKFRGLLVPQVLLKGNKPEIENWRKRQRILKTKKIRPDLFEKYLQVS